MNSAAVPQIIVEPAATSRRGDVDLATVVFPA